VSVPRCILHLKSSGHSLLPRKCDPRKWPVEINRGRRVVSRHARGLWREVRGNRRRFIAEFRSSFPVCREGRKRLEKPATGWRSSSGKKSYSRPASCYPSIRESEPKSEHVKTTVHLLIIVATLSLLATPAVPQVRIPCLWSPLGGCSVTLVSPEYAARPVQPLNPQAALAAINTFRAENGRKPLVLDGRLSRAAAMQSKAQAARSRIGHYGAGGSTAKDRARRAGYPAKIASENVASGQKSFNDALGLWKGSSGHRTNLLRPNVTAAGVAMAKNKSGRAYWTLVLGAE
jgi:uncharacterized protein YkwD